MNKSATQFEHGNQTNSSSPIAHPRASGQNAVAALGAVILDRASQIRLTIGGDEESQPSDDWWDITDAEQRIYDIDEVLYPTMITTLDA